jgi:hypothetical protein
MFTHATIEGFFVDFAGIDDFGYILGFASPFDARLRSSLGWMRKLTGL